MDALLRLWPWLLLALGVVLLCVKYVPALCLAMMDTETVVLPLLYHDIIDLHHAPADWQWGGASALFPDISVFFLLEYACHSGMLALKLLMVFFFVGWLAASVGLIHVLSRPHRLGLCALQLFFWVGMLCNFSLPMERGVYLQNALFQPLYHSGTAWLTLICLSLLISQIKRSSSAVFGWLAALVFLTTLSDDLFLVIFVLPALATLASLAFGSKESRKRYLILGLTLALVGAAGHFLAPYLFPIPLATGKYLQFNLSAARASFSFLMQQLSLPEHRLYAFLVILDALTVLSGMGGLIVCCFSRQRKRASPVVLGLLVFCTTTILFDWLAALGTGDYEDITSNRYLTVALLLPLFLAVFGLHSIILWRPWLEKLFAVAAATFAAGVAFIPQPPSDVYLDTRDSISSLKRLMKENHIEACLGDYWRANLVAFVSNGDVPLRAITPDGVINHWYNSLAYFGKGQPVENGPRFRMIYMPDHQLSGVFGKPDQIVYTAGQEEVWLYSEARSIRYNEHFNLLSNRLVDNGRTWHSDGSDLPGSIGSVQGSSRLAVAGHDDEGYLSCGPFLPLQPARYRATLRFAYLAPPAKDQQPVYDLLAHTGDTEKSSHSTPLVASTGVSQTFTDDFTVTQLHQIFEMRVYYHHSGTMRLDSLAVTYLGP